MMKKLILPLAVLLVAGNVWGQVESPIYKTVAEKFEQEYNLNRYDSIFTMFSSEMQNALPFNKTIEFFNGLNIQAGKITQMEFVKYEMQTYASYKTMFEMGLFLVNISVDNPAPQDMQKMSIAGADLQSAPLNCGSVIRFNASASYSPSRVFRQSGQVVLR